VSSQRKATAFQKEKHQLSAETVFVEQ
jgi:hypothetical protein